MSIQDLLQQTQVLKVPKFQRNYAWDKERVTALWEDLMDTFGMVRNKTAHMPEAEYLLGPVVLVSGKSPGEFLVIDGQQRLSTFTLLFCVARDILLEYKHLEGLEKIYNLIENRYMDKRTGWKLELNDIDKKLFQEIQEYESNEEPQWKRLKKRKDLSKSEKYLRDNYLLLYNKIKHSLMTNFDPEKEQLDSKQKIGSSKSSSEELEDIRKNNIPMLNYFLSIVGHYNFVVMIMVNDDSTAFQIFETLNERGQTLSKSNLIKNHILNQVDTNDASLQHELSDKWNNMFDKITKQGQRDDDFLLESLRSRYFVVSPSLRHSDLKYKISTKNLYKIIKDMVRKETECRRYIQELEEDAAFLGQLNEPASYQDGETRDEIYAIRALGAKFIRTPMLAAYRRWGMTENYRTLVRLLVRFFFKYRIVRQMHPGKVEDVLINSVTKMIHHGDSLRKIVDKILDEDDHDDFKRDFTNKFLAEPGKEVAKYVLQQITVHLSPGTGSVGRVDDLVLEHILQKPFTSWSGAEFFAEHDTEHALDEFVPRLGNLTLLDKPTDIMLQNGSFLEKRSIYGATNLAINDKTICNHDKWTARTIKQREEEFAKYADTIWNLDSYRS